jgi:hypothetical protein
MDNLYYTPFDLAVIINGMRFGIKKESEIIDFVWKTQQNFIHPKYRNSKRNLVQGIYYWEYYLQNKPEIDREFPTVQNELSAVGAELSECEYIRDFSDLDLFFKNLRLRILFDNKKGYVRLKLRTLLKAYGYLRRSQKLVNHINDCISFYRLKPCLRDNIPLDIQTVDIDEMITFRTDDTKE